MDYRIEEIIKTMRFLDESAKRMPMAKLDPEAVKVGLAQSENVCAQEEFVFATPWMKNLMVVLGDVTQTKGPDGKYHTSKLRCGDSSKAVDLVNKWVDAALLKYNGKRRDHYDEMLPVSSIEHYNTDCWLGWKPKVWDIQPGQADERSKVFLEYTQEKTNMSVEDLIRLIRKDVALQKALLVVLDILPEVQAAREIRAISDPFMSKGSGVSYPDYKNDRTQVPGKGITYGKYEIELAAKALASGLEALVKFAYDNNVYTGYPRNQRGKGRALEAESRRTNLVINMLNSPEIERWKESPVLGVAFLTEEEIKKSLVEMAEWVEANPDYVARNEDTSGWDRSVGAGWVTLAGALRYLRTNGTFSKRIAEVRHNCARKAWFIDGPNHRVSLIYGRTMSGYDDTTLQNSTGHRAVNLYALLRGDRDYTKNVVYPTRGKSSFIVGDDVVMIMHKGDEYTLNFRKVYKDMGYTIHSDEKSIFGVMFIQYRVFRDPKDGHWVMAYNWPRVFRSMLSKETAKQLGKAGWAISGWQQLGKLVEWPEACQIPLNFICACDQFKLFLFTPIDELKAMIKAEDEARIKQTEGKASDAESVARVQRKKVRSLTTAERLSNNPTLPGVLEKDGNVEIDWDYFTQLQQKLRVLYDPEFLPKLGFQNPDLSLIKESE